MNNDPLKRLHVDPRLKRRSSRFLWYVLLGTILAAAVFGYYAWPREETTRVVKDSTDQNDISQSVREEGGQGSGADRDEFVLTASGYIINKERIELSPRFMGVVKWIGVNKGDAVTNGQVVVLLDDAEYQARAAEVEGRLASAKVAVAKAELDFERVQKLSQTQIESQQAEDNARIQLEAARAALREVEAQYALMKTYLDWTVIRSPIDGIVLERLVDANELVVPQSFGGTRGPSTALIALADPNNLQVELDLNESDLGKVYLGQECVVRPEAYPERRYGGYVAEIAPEADRQKGTLQVKVQIREPDRYLIPELTARVDFRRETHAE